MQASDPGLQAAGQARMKAMHARDEPFTSPAPVANAQWPGPALTQESATQQQRCLAQVSACPGTSLSPLTHRQGSKAAAALHMSQLACLFLTLLLSGHLDCLT